MTTCKSVAIWKEYAESVCQSMGGIEKFDISDACTITVAKEGVVITKQ